MQTDEFSGDEHLNQTPIDYDYYDEMEEESW